MVAEAPTFATDYKEAYLTVLGTNEGTIWNEDVATMYWIYFNSNDV